MNHVIYGIEPFNDIFYQSCFMNSFVPVIRYYKKSLLPFMINDMNSYDIDEKNQMLTVKCEPVRPYNEILEENGVVVGIWDQNGTEIDYIKASVDQDRPVIIWVDTFYESLRHDTYHQYHLAHTWLIFGYNDEKRVFSIIEHNSKDSLDYEKHEVSYDELVECSQGYKSNFLDIPDRITSYDMADYVPEISNSIYLRKFLDEIKKNKDTYWNGIAKLQNFVDEISVTVLDEQMLSKKSYQLVESLNHVINEKKYERFRLELLQFRHPYLLMSMNKIIEDFSTIRSVIVKFQLVKKYNKVSFSAVNVKFQNILQREKDCLNLLLTI